MNCAFFDLIRSGLSGFTLHLQPNLHNLEWVREHYLATTSGTTGDELPPEFDPSSFWIRRTTTNKIIDGQLNRFLGGNTLQTRCINTLSYRPFEDSGQLGEDLI